MEGFQIGTLYKLSITPIAPTQMHQTISSALTVTIYRATDITLWHKRMEHVNAQVIKKV